MTIDIQVQCINKANRHDPYSRIMDIGGINNDGTRWRINEDDAIKFIEQKTYSFYVRVAGKRANIIVALHNGRKYLRTVADGVIVDNLLSLDECPI